MIRNALLAAALAGAAMTGAAFAQGAPPAPAQSQGRDCFYGGNVNGFRAVDSSTVNLSVGTKEIYQVKLAGPSFDLKWTNGLALVARGGGNFICSAVDADLVVPGPTGPDRIPVTSIRRLTIEQVAALPSNQRP